MQVHVLADPVWLSLSLCWRRDFEGAEPGAPLFVTSRGSIAGENFIQNVYTKTLARQRGACPLFTQNSLATDADP